MKTKHEFRYIVVISSFFNEVYRYTKEFDDITDAYEYYNSINVEFNSMKCIFDKKYCDIVAKER